MNITVKDFYADNGRRREILIKCILKIIKEAYK